MSDYKNYIVNYDISANAQSAVGVLESLKTLVNDISGPMSTLATDIGTVSRNLAKLKTDAAAFEFKPTINDDVFLKKLKSMETAVEGAATRMHQALYKALTGNIPAEKAISKAADKSFTSTKGIEKKIASLNKQIEDKWEKNRAGGKKKIENFENNTTRQEILALQRDLEDQNILLEKAKELEGKTAALQSKNAKRAKLTNVTPATIKAWKDAFGDARSRTLTLNIKANAESGKNGALTVIRQVEAGLAGLKDLGNITIKPLIDETAFQTTRAKLNDLVALSNAIAAPFKGQAIKNPAAVTSKEALNGLTADEKKKYLKAESQANKLQNKIASVQSRLDTNRNLLTSQYNPLLQGRITQDEKLLTGYKNQLAVQQQTLGELQQKVTPAVQGATKNIKPLAVDVTGSLTGINTAGKEFVVPVIGNITKVTPPQNVEIPASVKILAEQVNESLRALPRPSLTVNVVLDTKGVAAQLQSIGASITPTKNATSRPATATPAPVQQTFPALTAAEETQMNNLLTGFHKLNKAQETAANNLSKARTQHQEIGSAATLKKLQGAEEKYGTARQAYIDSFNQLKPLMYKQFQSTASRKLTDDEIRQGIGAQNKVDQLLGKKKLTAVQKEELAKAQSTLKELRAPLVTQPTPAPSATPTLQQLTAKVAKPFAKPTIPSAITPPLQEVGTTIAPKQQPVSANAVANITEVRTATGITIPVTGELTKVAIKLPSELVVPVLGKFNVANLQEQINAVPAIALDLNTTLALEKLEAFIRQIKERSPQNIALTASGAATKPQPAKPATQPVATQPKAVKPAIQSVATSALKYTPQPVTTPPLRIADIPFVSTTAPTSVPAPTQTKPQSITINATANVTEVRSAKEAVIPVIGELTKVMVKLPSETIIPISGKLNVAHLEEQIKAIPRPTMFVNMELAWKKGAIGKQEQLKAIQDKVPPIKLTLDPKLAIEKLNEFVTLVQSKSPQNIKLTASGSGSGGNSGSGNVNVGGGSSIASGSSSGGGSNRNAADKLKANKLHNSLLPYVRSQGMLNAIVDNHDFFEKATSVFGVRPTPDSPKAEQLNYLNEVTKGIDKAGEKIPWPIQDEKNKLQASIDKEREDQIKKTKERRAKLHENSLQKMRADIANRIAPFVSSKSQLDVVMAHGDFFQKAIKTTGINPVKGATPQQMIQYLNGVKVLMEKAHVQVPLQLNDEISKIQASIDKTTQNEALKQKERAETKRRRINRLRQNAISNAVLPFVRNQGQLDMVTKNFEFFKRAMRTTGITPTAGMETSKMLKYLQGVASEMQKNNVRIPFQLQSEIDNLQAANEKLTGTANEKYRKSVQERANRIRQIRDARVSNAALPFVSSQSQLNTVVKYQKYFKQAMASTGITPTVGMSQQKMLQYLQGVSQQMQNANVQIPWQLQSTINQLQAQIAKATQAAAQASQAASTASKAATGSKSKVQTVRMENQPKSFYDRTRKWAYPFTGNTSFGARTPMAVEMAKGMGVMFAVGGAMSAVGGSFSEAVEYQNLMRTTNAILKNGTDTYTPSGFSNMERTVRDVGIKTKFSAPEVASAAKFLAMAGYDIEAINNAIQPIADLALIGDADLGETADKMTNIMTTFGYDAKYLHKHPDIMRQLGNIMATTATRSNTDLMMLAESAKYGGGVAKLYGGMDKNLFADTMALFGVMGNAGIQASSAGTALRMMYQNIFKPNKNQQKMLDRLKDVHGIRTINEDKSLRSMTDILIDIANKVPQNEMAEVVGSLFRITAQPGAAAALNAAAQADGTDAGEVGKGFNAIADFTEKKGLGALVSLMEANRASVNGNILGSVAEEKQNTIKGLWAQVTSTFTEGILQAFEKNEGYFVQKLSELRDYLAKPETTEMIQKLIDMVISIGEIMAKFVKIWVDFYQKFEPIVKAWIVTQMFFTQVGSLIAPLVSVISVFDRLRTSLMALAGVEAASSVSRNIGATGALVGASSMGRTLSASILGSAAPSMLVGGVFGNKRDDMVGVTSKAKGASSLAAKYQQYKKRTDLLEAYIMSRMAMEGFYGDGAKNVNNRRKVGRSNKYILAAMDEKRRKIALAGDIARQHEAVRARHSRIYHPVRRMSRAFNEGLSFNPFLTMGSWLTSIKTMFSGLMIGFAKAIGLLFNPFTLVAAAAGTLGYAVFKLGQYASSATDAQIEAYRDLKKELENSANNAKNRHSGTDKLLEQNGLGTSRVEGYKEDPEYGKPEVSEFAKNYPYLFNNEIVSRSGASRKANKSIAESMKAMYSKDATMKLALGDEYEKYINNGLVLHSEQIEERALDHKTNRYIDAKGRAGNAIAALLSNWLFGEKDTASDLIDNSTILAIKAEGAKSPKVLQAREQILDLYKEIGYTDEFVTKAKNIAKGAANIDDPNLVGDEYITKEKLQNQAFDISRLKSYVQAGYNVLIGEAEGKEGSLIGFLKTQSEIKKELTPYSEDWWKQVSQIANNYKLIQDIEFGGKAYKDIEILVKMSSNGELDYANILKQVQEHIAGFNGNLQWYFQFVDQIYGLLAGAGKIPNTPESRRNFLLKAAGGRKLSEQEVEDYHVSTENELYGSPSPLAPKKDDDDLKSWFQRQNESFENAVGKYLEAKDKVLKTSPTPNTDGKDGKDGTGNPDPAKQDDYGSNYDRSAAKPTQIIFNIDKLANFDRTTVAASSEERDLMNAIESKMAEVVYRIVAEAMNTANNMRS